MKVLLPVYIVVSLLFGTQVTSAALSSLDDPNYAGSNNLTYDSATNLEWLNVSLSNGMSFNQVVGSGTPSAVASFPGYRYATAAEVATFWQDAGVSVGYFGTYTPIEALQSLWGATGGELVSGPGPGQLNLYGFTNALTMDSGSSLPPSSHLEGNLFVSIYQGYGTADIGSSQYDTDSSPSIGSALVRTVPEPSTLALLGLGSLGLLVRRKFVLFWIHW